MVAIFTRSLDGHLASLVKKIDSQAGSYKGGKKPLRSFVVYLTDDPDAAEGKLKEFATKNGIKNIPLTIFDGVSGPPKYKIAKEADLTVLLWKKQKVEANHAYGTGQFDAKGVEAVVKDLPKILE